MDDETIQIRHSRIVSFSKEIGLYALYYCERDIKLFCLQRAVRTFAYGGATLILVSYLSHLGISDTKIGLFMTLTLAGDIIISFILTLFADRLGRRFVLAAGALLMTLSGIVFALSGNYFILLAAAVVGVISPSGNEIGPFRAIEESAIAQLSIASVRGDLFAWYSLTNSGGAAIGTLVGGWVTQRLQNAGWSLLDSYRVVFFSYAGVGVIKFLLVCALSDKVEVKTKTQRSPSAEEEPLLRTPSPAAAVQASKKSWFLPTVSTKTTKLAVELCLIFALDSFASGLAPISWSASFFYRKFHLHEGQLGTIFSAGFFVSSTSVLLASSIAKRIGNVKAMAFCHLPSGIACALMPLPPTLGPSVFFLILRACTAQMDVAPRQAFLSAIIPGNERTAVLGLINVVKTFAQSIGPLITGILAKQNYFWVVFVLSGSLKVVYDLSILVLFTSYKSQEEANEERAE